MMGQIAYVRSKVITCNEGLHVNIISILVAQVTDSLQDSGIFLCGVNDYFKLMPSGIL